MKIASTSAASRPPVLPAEARTREPRFVKPIALPGVANLITLDGKSNYQAWSDQMAMVFKASGMYEVIKGKEVEQNLGYNNKDGFPSTILDTVNVKQYQQMIGSLMYTVTRT